MGAQAFQERRIASGEGAAFVKIPHVSNVE